VKGVRSDWEPTRVILTERTKSSCDMHLLRNLVKAAAKTQLETGKRGWDIALFKSEIAQVLTYGAEKKDQPSRGLHVRKGWKGNGRQDKPSDASGGIEKLGQPRDNTGKRKNRGKRKRGRPRRLRGGKPLGSEA